MQADDLLSAPRVQQPARLRVTGKGQKERVVFLTAESYDLLQAWLAIRPASPHQAIF